MKKHILLSFVLLLTAMSMSAVPARPGRSLLTQPDGSTILVTRHGDEWCHWLTDEQGRTVVKDSDGYYRPISEAQAQAMRHQGMARRAEARRHYAQRAGTSISSGQKRFFVVLVQFPDLAFSSADAQASFNNLMNQVEYSDNGATGSARDFYYQNSKGAFEPVFDVYGPVTVSHDRAYYGGNNSSNQDSRPEEAVYEACQLLDSQVDYSRYDNDGDGLVDLVFMYYAGRGEADSDDEDAIWPHQWTISWTGLILDGKKMGSYACTNELIGSGSRAGQMVGIGTACHEFGHALGLPDFYDTDYDTNGIAGGLYDFSLMSGGSYNNEGRTPPYLNIEERIILGWADRSDIQVLSQPGNYTLEPVHNNKAYMTQTDQDGEYFVYECRDNSGWDACIPSHGMLVYHADRSSRIVNIGSEDVTAADLWDQWSYTNAINENGSHPCFSIVSAVDQENTAYGYVYLSSYGVSYFDPYGQGLVDNIPFPGAGNVTSYTAKSWNGVESAISLNSIGYSGGKVSFTVPELQSGHLNYYSIKNPGNGVYAKGGTFTLSLNAVAPRPYSSVQWSFDGNEVSGTTVSLTASGPHVIEAVVTLSDGKRQIVTLEIVVNE